MRGIIALGISFDATCGLRVPSPACDSALMVLEYALPFREDGGAMKKRIDDNTVSPLFYAFVLVIEMVGDMVAPFSPVVAEVSTEAATPSCPSLAVGFSLLDMLFF